MWHPTGMRTKRFLGFMLEVQLNGSVKKVLRSAPGWNPPTLLFHFVDSAIGLSDPSGYLGY